MIAFIGKGGYFGELALVTHRPRAASAYSDGTSKIACKFTRKCVYSTSLNRL